MDILSETGNQDEQQYEHAGDKHDDHAPAKDFVRTRLHPNTPQAFPRGPAAIRWLRDQPSSSIDVFFGYQNADHGRGIIRKQVQQRLVAVDGRGDSVRPEIVREHVSSYFVATAINTNQSRLRMLLVHHAIVSARRLVR
jgi:hypothetical protein